MQAADLPAQSPTVAQRYLGRPIFGAVYQLITAADPNKYIGHSGRAPWHRVNEHRRRQLWGHEILPGRRGYRVLRWVEESGRGRAFDEANLRYHEALLIAAHNPTENLSRPVPVPPEQALARARPIPGAPARRPVFRLVAFAFWVAVYTAAAAWLLSFSALGALPWLLAPSIGLVMGWTTLWEFRRRWDRLTRPTRRYRRRIR